MTPCADNTYEDTHEYTVQTDSNGHVILKRDGRDSYCPFLQPMIAQGNIGQQNIFRLPCTTGCPHARIEEDREWQEYVITCGGTPVRHKISKQKGKEAPVKSLIHGG